MSKLVSILFIVVQSVIREFQTIALLLTLGYFVVRRIKPSRLVKLINRIPGPTSLPVLGNSIECNVDNQEVFNRIISSKRLFGHKKGLNRIWLGGTPYVFIHTAENAEPILNNSRTIHKSSDYRYIEPWLGNGLLTSAGHIWHQRRKILTPAFHFRILEDFVEVFQEQSEVLVRRLGEVGVGESVNVFPYVTLCTLDIVCETAMGRKINAQGDSNSDYVKAVYEIGSIIQKRQAKIYLQPDILFRLSSLYKKHQCCLNTLHSFSYKVINERKAELEARKNTEDETKEDPTEHVKKRPAFLDLLIEASERHNLTDENIREEVDTFMFEGHDTTSAAICWTLLLLGSNQEIQNKVYEEIVTTSSKASSLKPFTTRSLNSMKYLEACIKEALRLYPSVPFIARKLSEDIPLPDYVLPRDTEVIIVVYNLHRNPEVFPRPELYDPDRFLSENAASRNPYAYIPFSAGPRNCIGQKFAMLEEKVILASILRRFRVEAVDRREDLTLLGELILRPQDGIRVRLFPR
ncbi:hypothetical protein M8J75_016388 [Diaphorina citri]|nr:hypothetical protein M8J75_016388 [Diaphorina citri]